MSLIYLLQELEAALEHLDIQHITLQVESEKHYDNESRLCEVELKSKAYTHIIII